MQLPPPDAPPFRTAAPPPPSTAGRDEAGVAGDAEPAATAGAGAPPGAASPAADVSVRLTVLRALLPLCEASAARGGARYFVRVLLPAAAGGCACESQRFGAAPAPGASEAADGLEVAGATARGVISALKATSGLQAEQQKRKTKQL